MNEQIWLKKNKKYGQLCFMTEDLLEETLSLRAYIRDQMADPEWFTPSGRKDFETVLRDGFALVCLVDGKVIASLQCLTENIDYGRDIYEDEDILKRCADYSDVFVHPEYRGNGLQNLMEKKMEKLCLSAGKDILLGTVDPDNIYSYQNFIKSSYHPIASIKKYGGLDRVLMKKELNLAGTQAI